MNEIIYRSYDRDALDAQLNNRERVPQFEEYFQRWRAESDKVAGAHELRGDLAYGPSPGERIDLLPAEGPGPSPLLIFVHGGWWQTLDKADFLFPAPAFLKRGIAYASVNYDLAPKADIPEIVEQVRRAVAWLSRNAPDHGIDPDRIFLTGHSAGGHLAVCCLTAHWPAYGFEQTPVKGCLSISGIYDLTPIPLSYQQPVLRVTPEAVAACSPRFQPPKEAPPLICAVGATESEEFLDQQAEFIADWRAAGLSVEEVALPGRDHFSAVDALVEEDHPLLLATLSMIAR
ncbi:MAG: alpha/beta hydrolase [Limibacillus sp.]